MEKIRVLQVNKLYYPEIGGIEKVLQQISEGLSVRDDIELKVLVCQKKGKGVVEHVNGVEVHRAGSFGVVSSVPISISFLWKFRKIAKEADIVHLHMPFPLGDLACLLSGYRGKVVVYWHSDVVKQKKWMILYRPVMELFLKRVDLVLVSAKGIARGSKYLRSYFNKCHVVPFAVEDRIFVEGQKYLEKHGYDRAHENLRFLFVGRLVYYKGCSVLIEAFSKLKGDAKLTLVGSGNLETELKNQCKKLGIEKKVVFAGNVSDEELGRYFEEADVFVLPSIERSEAFALVQMEAMAYGIPVINTNLPSGVPEVSLHGETGLTVEPNNVIELAEAMEWMIKEDEERVNMGIRARKRVEDVYTQKTFIKNIMRVYRKLINRT